MYNVRVICEDTWWLGASDRRIQLFENTYPVPAGVREAVDAALAAAPLNRYPDPMSNDLRDELAAWTAVPWTTW